MVEDSQRQAVDEDDDDDDDDDDLTATFADVNKEWDENKPTPETSAKPAPSLSSPLPNKSPVQSGKSKKRTRIPSSDEEEDVPQQPTKTTKKHKKHKSRKITHGRNQTSIQDDMDEADAYLGTHHLFPVPSLYTRNNIVASV
jgi:hypothetical protein